MGRTIKELVSEVFGSGDDRANADNVAEVTVTYSTAPGGGATALPPEVAEAVRKKRALAGQGR